MPLKISILVFDMSNNGLVRVYPIAKVLEKRYELEFIGPSVKGGVFKPYEGEFDYQIVNGSLYFPMMAKTLKDIRDRITGDVVYAFKPKTASLVPALWKKKAYGTPVVLDIEDWEYAISRQNKLKALASYFALPHPNSLTYLYLLEKLAAKADERIVATRFLQKRFGGQYIPHGADTYAFDPKRFDGSEIRKKYCVGDEKLVMFTGTPNRYKGMTELVEAIGKANEGGGKYRLMIVGGDKENEYVKSLMRQDHVTVTGFMPHSMMGEFLAAADMVALPSRKSPITDAQIPAKVFEAMAMAKPVVASDVSDLSEILDSCGVVVEPGNVEGLRDAITKVGEDQAYAKKLGIKARSKCRRSYSWEWMGKQLYSLFERFE